MKGMRSVDGLFFVCFGKPVECAGHRFRFSKYDYKPPNNLRFFALAVIINFPTEQNIWKKPQNLEIRVEMRTGHISSTLWLSWNVKGELGLGLSSYRMTIKQSPQNITKAVNYHKSGQL